MITNISDKKFQFFEIKEQLDKRFTEIVIGVSNVDYHV